jgi:hypothetical protein
MRYLPSAGISALASGTAEGFRSASSAVRAWSRSLRVRYLSADSP